MVQRSDAVAVRDSLRDVVTLAHAELVTFWRSLDLSDSTAVAAAVRVFAPELVADYGEIAASVAADFYDSARAEAGVSAGFAATLAASAPAEQVSGGVGWAVGPLFTASPDVRQALRQLASITERLVQQQARNTISDAVRDDPVRPRYARMPTGAETCAFCELLASRGAVYRSSRAAGELDRYHDACDCQPVPVFDGDDLPYDAGELFERYAGSRARASSGDPERVLAQMRVDYGIA